MNPHPEPCATHTHIRGYEFLFFYFSLCPFAAFKCSNPEAMNFRDQRIYLPLPCLFSVRAVCDVNLTGICTVVDTQFHYFILRH
jgi:hypothetical protein